MGIRLVDKFIEAHDRVTVTRMGNITELQYMEKSNHEPRIRKIDKYTYEVLATGEIRQFSLSEKRKDNTNSLRQTFKRLAYLINSNFSGRKNEFWITLTYAKKEYDYKKMSKDYNLFIKRLRYQTRSLGELQAIGVKEPHADGSWHMHMLLKYPHRKKAYIANERFAEIWGHGFVEINHIKHTDNVGAYLTPYLTDVSLDELEVDYETTDNDDVIVSEDECSRQTLDEVFSQEGAERITLTKTDKSKAVVKGGRLSYYPVGMKIYTVTGDLREPERFEMTYEHAREKFGLEDENLTIRRSLKIEDEENDFENTIVIEQYNKRVRNYGTMLCMLRKYKKTIADCLAGKRAKDFFYDYAVQELYALEHKFDLLNLNKEFHFFKNGGV